VKVVIQVPSAPQHSETSLNLKRFWHESRYAIFSQRKNWIFPRNGRILFYMKLILSTHNVTLTKAIEDHIIAKLEKLDHMDQRIVDARVTLEHDHTRVPEKQFSCSVRLGVRGPDLFAKDIESDLYTAMDVVVKKIEQQIRKRHSKVKAKKHKVGARTKRTRQEAD
jgi:putative sigma-54 modulation protein